MARCWTLAIDIIINRMKKHDNPKNYNKKCLRPTGAMAALAPQQRQCELESYYPAGTLVKPPLCGQAAGTLSVSNDNVLRN